jgi:4-aminobutyrate aminotransferase-like enzyme
VHAQTDQLLDRRRSLLGSGLRQFYTFPFQPVRGKGVWLYDEGDKAYLDAYNNVPHVGHCHPRVVEAIARQSGKLNTNTRYLDDIILDYAEKLKGTLPEELSSFVFVCSGTEANELAWRLSKEYTGGSGALVSSHAYHGNSSTISAFHGARPADPANSWVTRIPSPGLIATQFRDNAVGGQEALASYFVRAIDALRTSGHKPAAAYFDTSFCSDGLHIPMSCGFMNGGIERWRAAGGLMVADEVLAGFGRLGTHMWGFEALGVIPDIVTMGKPAGNGYPLGVVVTRPEILSHFFKRQRYFNTFGGNQVACAAGIAVLEVLEIECLQQNAAEVGSYLKSRLVSLAKKNDMIGDVRGSGLFIGVDLVDETAARNPAIVGAQDVMNNMAKQGVLVGLSGPTKSMLKIRPPMIFSKDNSDQLVDTLESVLECM